MSWMVADETENVKWGQLPNKGKEALLFLPTGRWQRWTQSSDM